MTKPGIERLLFLAVGFEPATVDAENFSLQPNEEWRKLIYVSIEQRHKTCNQFKNSCITKPGIEHLLFLAVGFEPATVGSKELYATNERRMVKVSIYIHRTKAASQIL
jgi:hypothetical protein